MARRLAAKGTYFEQGDFVMVEIFLINPDNQVFHPEEVASGLCRLRNASDQIIGQTEFDMYNGNADGGFKCFFMHPSHVTGLDTEVLATLRDGNDYQYRDTVIIELYDNELAENDAQG
jgi:hypothetical protein